MRYAIAISDTFFSTFSIFYIFYETIWIQFTNLGATSFIENKPDHVNVAASRRQDAAGWWVFTLKAGRGSMAHRQALAKLGHIASVISSQEHLSLWKRHPQYLLGTRYDLSGSWKFIRKSEAWWLKSPSWPNPSKIFPPLNEITFDDGCVAPWEAKLPGKAVTETGRERERYRQKKRRKKERNRSRGLVESWYHPPQHHSSISLGARLTAL